MILSACGLRCDECEFFGKQCNGCYVVQGQTFWAKEMMPNQTCPLFDCSVNKKGFKSCGNCSELPCKLFKEMKDPNSSEEEHQRMLKVRVNLLKENV
ncbi:MAG: DUF3795 domain-containing protein [Bacteroidales bacterium]|nr:DUF3795 domain-containing protein [Bacteroidales bacterium]MBK7173280.1 DUF3795 domain-containing protein [Bacteroidales bacterium]